jgi:hypothetical protein
MKRVKAKKKPSKAKKTKSRAKSTKQGARMKSKRMRTADSDGGVSGPP